MRKLFISLFFLGLSVLVTGQNLHYFTDAGQLETIASSNGFKQAQTKYKDLSASVNPKDSSIWLSDSAKKLADAIRPKIKVTPTVIGTTDSSKIPKDNFIPSGGTRSPSGPQAMIDLRVPHDVPGADEVAIEINAALFLLLDSAVNDYNHVKGIPQQFEYLDQIAKALQDLVRVPLVQPLPNPVVIGTSTVQSPGFAFSEANLINGLTDFIIKQAKAELAQVYLTRWYDMLSNNPITGPLLPQTLNVLNAFIQDNAVSLAKYGDKWKAAFQEDLRNIPVKLQDETLTGKILDVFKPTVELKKQLVPLIAGGDYIVYNLYLKKHILSILADLATTYKSDLDPAGNLPVFKRIVLLADLVGSIGGDLKDDNSYAPVKLADLKKLDANGWKFLLRLAYGSNNLVMAQVFGQNAGQFLTGSQGTKLGQLIQGTVSVINSFQNLVTGNNTNAGKTNQLTVDEARKLFDVSFQLLDNAAGYLKLFDNGSTLYSTYTTNIKPCLSGLSEIGDGISGKDYGKVLDGFVAILSKAGTSNSSIIAIQRFGSFMVNILTAQKPDDVSGALEELIPANQYKLKNVKTFTISAAAYPGIIGGLEWLSQYQTDKTGAIDYTKPKKATASAALAPYLPIGVDFNVGTRDSSSWSLFLQVLDLGAVLDYRLSSDTSVSSSPNIQFKQLLSPGLALLHRFRNSPVSIGISGCLTPSLRTINQMGTVYQPNALRLGLFVSVDVTGVLLSISKANVGPKKQKPKKQPKPKTE